MTDDNRVLIFDTTLRDGEQAPGATMTVAEKIEIAELLDRMQVDVIEAGFPISSPGDFAAVDEIAGRLRHATVAGLARASRKDIEAVAEATRRGRSRRIHTFISTSPIHMKYKLGMTPDAVLEAVIDSVGHARNLCDDVEWSCEDGTRSEREFLYRCFEAAIKAGARTVNIADTVGYIMPHEFHALITDLRATVPGMDRVRFSVHCHDDLGLGVANSLAAISAGARQIECTVNGIGERAGNASLEEVVMALHTRADAMPYRTGIQTGLLSDASRLVEKATGFVVPPNKAIVGRNAFAHESGIHQHGVLRNANTYEIIDPQKVGAEKTTIVIGKHSGRHGLQAKLAELGITLSGNVFEQVFADVKALGDGKSDVTDQEIVRIVSGYADSAPTA